MMTEEVGGALYDYKQYGMIEGEALRRFAAQISMLTEAKLDWSVKWLQMHNQIKNIDFDRLAPRNDMTRIPSRNLDERYIRKWRGYWRVVHSDNGRSAQKRRKILFEVNSQENGPLIFDAIEFTEPISNLMVESGEKFGNEREIVIGTGILREVGPSVHLIQILDQKSMELRHYFIVADLENALIAVHNNSLSESNAESDVIGSRDFEPANGLPAIGNATSPLSQIMSIAILKKL
ncbi:hypothetical protein [Jiella sonneratiae]|uniref:Uncharacterized protein n=1 Tax=Jiella sonneratiae TaxID=2816856 RepID=A0ABS3JA69_9HYPH|nr:hypothetical protein [Jiella sonneratiae]MBO0906569.1 hypothetical protein [Jiella sonneratiae]